MNFAILGQLGSNSIELPRGGATAALPNVAMQFEEGHSVRTRFLQNCAES